MPFRVSELREFILTDPNVKILIVEGRRDTDFWKNVVPVTERRNCVIYSIEEIDIPIGEGGNKGAALILANATLEWPNSERIHYFLDSDNDNLLGLEHSVNVTLTDFRDVESYTLIDEVFDRLCRDGANYNTKKIGDTRAALTGTARCVGVLRVVSERSKLRLPFQAALRDGSLHRFFKRKGSSYELSVNGLIAALANQAELSGRELYNVIELFKAEEPGFADTEDRDVVHGKDLIAFLSWYFEIPLDIAAGLVKLTLATEIVCIRNRPRIGAVEQWVRAA